MVYVIHLLYIEIILNIIILFFTPKQVYFKQNYLHKILVINYDTFGNIDNSFNIINNTIDNGITDTLSKKLNVSYKINNASLSFSIIVLLLLLMITLINIFEGSRVPFICKTFFSIFLYFINWAMNLAIYVKIKNIRENIDKIGLTNEIRKGIIIVIVLLSICMAYTIFGFIIVSNNGDSNDNKKIELKEEIRELEEEIKELKKKKNEINENGTLTLNSERRVINNNNSENKKIIELMNEIMEIKSCNPYLLKKNENLLSIIFISNDQTIKYSVVCKNTDKFVTAEQSLYERFNNYREGQNMFLFNGESLNRNKTIDELKIKNGDVITIAPFED